MVSCLGGPGTGQIVATGSGGDGNYQYSLDGGAFQTSGTFSGLSDGTTYEIMVQDGEGCTAVASNIIVNCPPIGCMSTTTICEGETLIATTSGGTVGDPLYTTLYFLVDTSDDFGRCDK